MHEDTIATIGEIERHRLILAVRLRTLRVGNHQLHFLSYLVQGTERLTTTIDTLARSDGQYGVDTAGVVATAFDKRERQEFYLAGVIVDDMTRLGQYLPFLVL